MPHPVPAYALYGEGQAKPLVEPLHVETIAERSRRHDWDIRPHRHGSLFQALVITQGRAELALDGAASVLHGPAAVTVPALATHGFVFARDVQGLVFTIADAQLGRLLDGHAALAARLRQLQAWPLGEAPAGRAVLAAAHALQAEFAADAPWRLLGLDAALARLLLALGRSAPAPLAAPAAGSRAQAHVQRLRALVEQQYRQQPRMAALAAQIGITPTQLNRACQQVLGHTAQQVLHERLLREARRELAYTRLNIQRIALDLGFCDAGYFTRFVQRHVGVTPSAWRQTLSSTSAMP